MKVLKPNGLFVINIKNHIRKGKIVDVWEWHMQNLISKNFIILEDRKISVKGNKFGDNSHLRVEDEHITLLKIKK